MCADLMLQGLTLGGDRLHIPNMQRTRACTLSVCSTPSFASSNPRALTNGRPCPNRKCNVGDGRR
jgi:hypothetical protein